VLLERIGLVKNSTDLDAKERIVCLDLWKFMINDEDSR
jgi:hypothetical protein